MVRMHIARILTCAALVATTTSCGDVVRQGRSPVYLVIDTLVGAQGNKPTTLNNTLTSDVITLVTSPPPCSTSTPCATIFPDLGQVRLRATLKDPGLPGSPSTPSGANDVTITRYHIKYERSDGRNAQGIDVPYEFDGAATGTIPANGTLTLNFEVVRYQAKLEPPLLALKTNPSVITTIATITFYGRDQAGNDVSVTGSMQIDFGNFGD